MEILNREPLRKAAAPYLRPGETLQYVIPAQTTSGYATMTRLVPSALALPFDLQHIGLIGKISDRRARYRIFVVTDQRVLVLDTGKRSLHRAYGVIAELPWSTRLGPPSGGLVHVINVKDEKLRVFFMWLKDMEKADSQRPGA
jgi:hypothetical protein